MDDGGRSPDLPSGVGVRRSPHLVSYWREGARWVFNPASGVRFRIADPLEARLIDDLHDWSPAGRVLEGFTADERPRAAGALDRLLAHSLLEATNRPRDPRERGLSRWGDWAPAASFFHFSTKNLETVDSREARETKYEVVTDRAYPDALKRYPDRPEIELPPVRAEGELPAVLKGRRTWRRFAETEVALDDIATLLGLTWGIQSWLHLDSGYSLPLKTSPSGGARHSIEVYLVAQAVSGLGPGTYHYCPDRHRLTDIGGAEPGTAVPTFFRQEAFHPTPALFIMTSVFERVLWRYRQARAYRVVTIETGHLGQTFCLLATALGLAPFGTGSFTDTRIEDHLGIDGVAEAPMYVVGVGNRPEGVDWAPYEWTPDVPPLTRPAHAAGPEDA